MDKNIIIGAMTALITPFKMEKLMSKVMQD